MEWNGPNYQETDFKCRKNRLDVAMH